MKQEKDKKEFRRRITFRLSEKEWEKLQGLLVKSTCRSHSELIRKILFKGKITVHTHDRSLDMVMETLSGIRTELHAIGVNINQITRRYHTEKLPEERLVQVFEIGRLYRQTDKKVAELFIIITKLSKIWLPE